MQNKQYTSVSVSVSDQEQLTAGDLQKFYSTNDNFSMGRIANEGIDI